MEEYPLTSKQLVNKGYLTSPNQENENKMQEYYNFSEKPVNNSKLKTEEIIFQRNDFISGDLDKISEENQNKKEINFTNQLSNLNLGKINRREHTNLRKINSKNSHDSQMLEFENSRSIGKKSNKSLKNLKIAEDEIIRYQNEENIFAKETGELNDNMANTQNRVNTYGKSKTMVNTKNHMKHHSETQILMNNKNINDEVDEFNPLQKNEILFTKIDKIYQLIDISEKSNPFKLVLLVLFFVNFLNIIFFGSINYVISDTKNNFYCFDNQSGSINVCEDEYFCQYLEKGINNLAYLSDEKIVNKDIITESFNINKYFRSIFELDSLRFSKWNGPKKELNSKNLDDYRVVFGINKNEEWNIFVRFNLACSRTKCTLLIGVSVLFGLFIFGIIFSYFADIFGRRPILIIVILAQIIGLTMISLFDIGLNNNIGIFSNVSGIIKDPVNGDSVSPKFDPCKLDEVSNLQLNNYIMTMDNYPYFNIERYNFSITELDLEFQKSFIFFQCMKKYTSIRRKYYMDNQIIFLFGLFLAFGAVPIIFNLNLTLIMETSVNLSSALDNYKFYIFSYVLAFFIPYYLLILFRYFSTVFILIAILQTCGLIAFIIVGIESPRFNYEISDWTSLRNFVNQMLKNKFLKSSDLTSFIKKTTDDELQNEIGKNNRWNHFKAMQSKRIIFSLNLPKFKKFYRKYKAGEIQKIEFQKLLKFPFLNFLLIFKDKHYRDYNFVVCSMVFNIGISLFLLQNKFCSSIILTRNYIYDSSINWFNILNLLAMFFSNMIFVWVEQIYGYPIVMSICYFFNFIFSLIMAIHKIKNEIKLDLNNELSSAMRSNIEVKDDNDMILTAFCSFFSHGLFFPLFLYLTKFTKTIYRATFYGFIHTVIFVIWMIAVPLTQYFSTNDFFSCVASFVGFFISYFVINNQDEILVQDFRRLVLDEK